jgi:pilus assembly protein FimV
MLDIQRLNPEAFIDDNINQLKAGYVLRLPTSAEISTDAEQAVAAVAQQDQNWQDNLAGINTRRLDASEGQDSSGVAGSDDEEGHLQIAGVEGAAEAAAMAGDLSARLEDLDRAQRDNQDLQARLDAMDQQLQMQQRLIELKDDQISALQQALTDTGDATDGVIDQIEGTIEPLEEPGVSEPIEAEPEPEPQPIPPPPPPPEPTLVDMLMDYALYIGAGALVLLLLLVWLLRNKLGIGLPGRRAKQEQAGGADEDDEFAGVELVSDDALIVDEFTGDAEEEAGSPEAIASFSAVADEDAYAAQFESGDALAEADIYIAYGRFPQAVDLLKTAIGMEPINTEYRLKLMEACIEMVESSEYQQQYSDLQVIGDEAVLQRAKSMLEAVDGGEVWLDDLPEPSLTEADVTAAKAALEAPGMGAEPALEVGHYDAEDESADKGEIDLDLDEGAAGDGLDLDLGDEADLALDAAADDAGLDLELDDAAGLSLEDTDEADADLDLDLGDSDLGDLEEDSGSVDLDLDLELEGADDAGDDAGAPLEFDMSEGLEELSTEASEEATEDSAVALDEEADAGDMDLGDFELEELATDEPEAADDSSLELDAAADEEDLDQFDMSAFDAEPAEESDAGESPELPDLELDDISAESGDDSEESSTAEDLLSDFGDLEIESAAGGHTEAEELVLDEGGDDTGGSVEEELSASVEDFDLDAFGDTADTDSPAGEGEDADNSGLMFATDGDEIATKLDLARAYMDMGDHDGARSILEEVLEDGSDDQKQEAQTLLDSID